MLAPRCTPAAPHQSVWGVLLAELLQLMIFISREEKALFLERQAAKNIIIIIIKVFIVEIFTRGRSHFTKTNLLPACDEDDVPPTQKRFFYPCPARITRYLCQSTGTTPPKATNTLLSLLNRAAVFLVHRGRAHAPVTELSKSHILY